MEGYRERGKIERGIEGERETERESEKRRGK